MSTLLSPVGVFNNLSSQTSLPFYQLNQQNHTRTLYKLQFSAVSRNDVNPHEMNKKTVTGDRILPPPYRSSHAIRPIRINSESFGATPSCSGLRCRSRKLGFVGARSVVARAEKDDDVGENEPAEGETETPGNTSLSFSISHTHTSRCERIQ